MTDIDIDFADRQLALDDMRYVFAVERRGEQRRRHISGVYFHNIPIDPIDGWAVWDHKEAAQRGYFKLDFLHNTIYDNVRDEAHLRDLMRQPPWDAFQHYTIVSKLAHIANHFDIVQMIQPRSIDDLAVCLALPRPGKLHLIGRPRGEIEREIWLPTDKYYFKRSHAIAYASTIVIQLNLMIEHSG